MTVFNTAFSSLEDAWGEPYLSPTLQKPKKKKKPADIAYEDPICDLYAMGNNHYQDSDIVSFANQYYDKHDKPRFQKPMMNKREPDVKEVDIRDGSVYAYGAPYNEDVQTQLREAMPPRDPPPRQRSYGEPSIQQFASPPSFPTVSEDDDEVYPPKRPVRSKMNKTLYDTQEYYMSQEDPEYYKKDSEFAMMDVLLYIISGIILIFMMEQFVKVGMMLH